ncbi:hypothetical protein BH11PAT1_BH11PAT1_5150 [soil metagenome]
MNLWAIFLTGLITGGLTCLAVQGGLLAATIAQREEEKLKEKAKSGNAVPILVFLLAKLAAYTVLGFLLGWFGSLFELSLTARVILQFAVGIFMLGTAFNILNVHPIFRYFIIQPPRFLMRLVRRQSKSKELFAPALLGGFTVFIPCGTTQAMMALAIASGKPFYGAAIMFAFVLGTSPVFFLLGYFATKLGDTMQQKFMKLAAYTIILLAVFNLNNTMALTGSNLTIESVWRGFWCTVSFCNDTTASVSPQAVGAVTDSPSIEIADSGYNPNSLAIKAGSQVTLHIKNTGGRGCTQTFTIPKLGIQKSVPIGNSDTIIFTAPTQIGELPFMCSMGMYRGTFNVI